MRYANISDEIVRDRYKIIDVLGKGGIGITYGAIDLQTQEKVAIKAVSLKQLNDWKQIELLEREAKVLAQLNHPAIPKYLDYFQIDSEKDRFFYIVQQLALQKSLFQLVETGWRTTEAEVKEIAKQILDIFIYLHSLKPPIIHRDIKPHNLIRSNEGKIYLVDFGAVQNTYYNTLMRGSTVVGTFGYMAPEQFQGKATTATDLYGLGATILYLLTHRSPAELPHDTLKIDFRSSVNISEGFANWLEKMLQPDLEDRFVSAKEALEGLSDRSLFTNTLKNKWKVAFSLSLIGAIGIGGIVGFNSYKWAILSRLGYMPLEICVDYKNNYDVIKNYLETGGDPNVTIPNNYNEIRHNLFNCVIKATASEEETKELIELLIAKGINRYPRDPSPLSSAVAIGSKDLVELLITKGIDVNTKDFEGKNPLFYGHNLDVVKLLIDKGIDVNARDKNGKTALFYTPKDNKIKIPLSSSSLAPPSSIVRKNLEELSIVKLLIDKGADVNAKDNEGKTALFYRHNLDVVELLIAKGADINAKDNEGKTTLFYRFNLDVVELLIAKGADVNAKDNEGKTTLFYKPDLDVVELLIAKGADIKARNNEGNTILFSTSNLKILEVLITKGTDINAKNKYGKTALFEAILNDNRDQIKLLIAKGADINAKDNNGRTPLFCTANNRQYEAADLLINNGANVNARDNRGRTPIFEGANLLDSEMVRLLINRGANVNARDNDGNTPLKILKNRKYYVRELKQDVIDILIKHGATE